MPDLTYKIKLYKSFTKEVKVLPSRDYQKLIKSIHQLATNPYPAGFKKLKTSEDDYFRIRVGNYRVIYQVNAEEVEILIIKVGHRKDVYS